MGEIPKSVSIPPMFSKYDWDPHQGPHTGPKAGPRMLTNYDFDNFVCPTNWPTEII